jgi:formylglycine-generating enzyme required for sulfatase activity/tRNA A-37 threonylcarbamoyl transferase component Bud32
MTNPSTAIAELGQRLQAALGEGYEVGRPLGSGGFAVVFLVRDLQLKRRLAVKVLSPDLITSNTMIERFRREAEAIAGLSHPNIVPLHFIGQKDDLLYLAMACIDSGSLADRLAREPQLPIDDATRILTEVASALGHAHKRGIIHRDIKPQNVLLDADGRALVTDFGIARTLDASSITASGLVLGTPAYLAPEQVSGEASDHRVDIYALGVMGYEIVTGRPPFEAPTAQAVLMKRLGAPPPPVSKARPEVPPPLEQVIDGCLATNPDERFGSAADIVRILTGRTPSSGGHLTSSGRIHSRASRPAAWVGAGALALVAVTAAVWLSTKRASRGAAAAKSAAVQPVDSEMVLIPAGDYIVGSDSGPANAFFRPAHRVTLAAFGVDRHEVSVGAYRAYVDSMRMPAPWRDSLPALALPVTHVTLSDATSYCRWKHPDGGRLPTEEEWEAAARGTNGRRFPWGDASTAGQANVASASTSPAPIGTFAAGATPEGIQDLIGNVWEWTSSTLRPYPNGPAIPDSMQQHRVIRGGAFNTLRSIATVWWRQPVPVTAPGEQLDKTGFRCAMRARAPQTAPSS